MYERRALDLLDQLRGRSVAGWHIDDLIRHGKSAAVFHAHNADRAAALKIFDPELVARYGERTQLTRIHRELSLRGRHHPHLVEIYDGGRCSATNHLFLVMQHVPGQPLSNHITTFERTRIRLLLQQIASAAKFLEDIHLVHRDIKPDNIVIDPDTRAATLLDFGVLRPINAQSTATDDDDVKHFIGTLQYSPPEFLLRQEEDSLEGWRAVTFYQLGAVLHDLIERQPIFADSTDPYARLVNAVQSTSPTFTATDIPASVNLARNCLVKSPATRLRLVSWNDFLRPLATHSTAALARQRIAQARQRIASPPAPNHEWQRRWQASQIDRELVNNIAVWLRQWCVSQELLPSVAVLPPVASGATDLTFGLHFRPAPATGLRHHLLLQFEVRVHDYSIRALELLADAMLSTSSSFLPDRRPYSVYRGVATESNLRPVFENTVYPVFEVATRESAQPGRIDMATLLAPDAEP